MRQKLLNSSVELDQELDRDVCEITRMEGRKSKRLMLQLFARRVVRLWKENPDVARELKLVRPE